MPGLRDNRVRIYKRNGNWVVETGGRELPPLHSLVPYMPSSLRNECHRGYSVLDALNSCINPQFLADALRAFYLEHVDPRIEEVEGVSAPLDGGSPIYMTMGNALCRVVPVEAVKTTRALQLLRRKGADEARAVAQRIRAAANIESRNIIERAEERLAHAEARARQRALEVRVPAWCAGTFVCASGESLELMFSFRFHPKRFVSGRRYWNAAVSELAGITVKALVPILSGNTYDAASVHAVKKSDFSPFPLSQAQGLYENVLPHMSHARSCVTIGDDHHTLDGMNDLDRLAKNLTRAFSIVNLDSLLVRDAGKWDVRTWEFIPPVLRDWLFLRIDSSEDSLRAIRAEGEENPAEAQAVWTPQMLRPTRANTG